MALKNKINLLITVFVISIVLLVVFGIYPLFTEIKKNSQEVILEKKTLLSLEAKTEDLEKFKNFYKDIEPNLEKIDNLFIDSETPVEFIGFLEKINRDCELSLKISLTPPIRLEKDSWPSVTFQMNSIGSFPYFLKFLEKLESSPYLIEIQNLSVNKLEKGDIQANFSLKVFAK